MCYILGCFSNRVKQSSGIFTSSGSDPVGIASPFSGKESEVGRSFVFSQCMCAAQVRAATHGLLSPGLLEMLTRAVDEISDQFPMCL